MLDDLLGNVGAQQEELEAKLKEIEISEKSQHGELEVSINGKKEILDISINKKFDEMGELEDLLVLTLNSAFQKADLAAETETKKLINSILPGGLSGLFG
ncbi:MAG TPA: YbaB/EbfC family DNA-binding protein [Bacteroidetes bacterium]|nr:YbaB/EbfC family DNA-binding protein [Bacteroidota bacterium]